MASIVTQFKDTPAFNKLQSIVCNEIAATFLARLREVGVPEDKLCQVSDDICYDLVSAVNAISDFEIPDAEYPAALPEEKTEQLAILEEKTDEITMPEERVEKKALLEERTDKIEIMNTDSDSQFSHPAERIVSRDELVKIHNDVKRVFA